jgi:hypothetical protein
MRLMFRVPFALAIALLWAATAMAAPKSKTPPSSEGAKKSGKEISTDDRALDKQMDWETKVLGPNTVKKIDLAKIQRLQAEELARREKQEKIDQAERERKERETAAAAAAQRNVKAPSTREVPAIPEPPPPKPVEKHDDAFVDKLLTGKSEKKKVAVSNDDVDQLLNKAKQEKPPVAAGKGRGKGADNVDQLLATADKQATIKTTARKPAEVTETVSAEAAAREATLKAIAAAAAQAQAEKARNKRPAVPDAAMLKAQAVGKSQPDAAKPSAARAAWTDPFAGDGPSATSLRSRSKGSATATVPPASSRVAPAAAGRHSPPATRPAGNDTWQDPFEPGNGSAKPRPAPTKAAPAGRPGKRPANWKDPFA